MVSHNTSNRDINDESVINSHSDSDSSEVVEWSDADKALWILQNGQPKYAEIFERVDDQVYTRPSNAPGDNVPPWVPRDRKLKYVTKKKSYMEAHNEFQNQFTEPAKHGNRFLKEDNHHQRWLTKDEQQSLRIKRDE